MVCSWCAFPQYHSCGEYCMNSLPCLPAPLSCPPVCVCVCACMYVIYIYIYIHICIYMCVYIYIYTYLHTTHMCAADVYKQFNASTHTCMYGCVSVFTNVCACVYMYACVYIQTHTQHTNIQYIHTLTHSPFHQAKESSKVTPMPLRNRPNCMRPSCLRW
jgi:hypothetical protein